MRKENILMELKNEHAHVHEVLFNLYLKGLQPALSEIQLKNNLYDFVERKHNLYLYSSGKYAKKIIILFQGKLLLHRATLTVFLILIKAIYVVFIYQYYHIKNASLGQHFFVFIYFSVKQKCYKRTCSYSVHKDYLDDK